MQYSRPTMLLHYIQSTNNCTAEKKLFVTHVMSRQVSNECVVMFCVLNGDIIIMSAVNGHRL